MVKTEWKKDANNEIRRGISQKELSEWDEELDKLEAEKPITIPITIADLPPECQAVGQEWSRARLWSWLDALAWIARPGPELITLMWAYRDLASKRWHDVEVVERACRAVLLMHVVDADLIEAERKLVRSHLAGSIDVENHRVSRVQVMQEWPGDGTEAQSNPTCFPADADTPIRIKLDDDEFRLWVAARVEEGCNQTDIVDDASAAFPGKMVPGRETRRKIHREEYRRLKQVELKPGKEVG